MIRLYKTEKLEIIGSKTGDIILNAGRPIPLEVSEVLDIMDVLSDWLTNKSDYRVTFGLGGEE
jgi:hypothetical protein